MTDPHSTAGPAGDDGSGPAEAPAPGVDEVVRGVQSAADGIAGVSDGPLAEAVTKLDALHRELQGALADLDRA